MTFAAYQQVAELTPLVSDGGLWVGEWSCRGSRKTAIGQAIAHEVVIVQSGAFRVETDRGAALIDSSRALLLAAGSEYEVAHPAGCGDRCLLFALSTAERDALLSVIPEVREAVGGGPVAARTLPGSPALAIGQHRFVRAAKAARHEQGDTLAAAERAAELLRELLAGRAAKPEPPSMRSAVALRRRRDRVEAVRTLLHRRLGEPASLADLAAAVHRSSFQLARDFRAETGESIHRYRTRLRVETALGRLRDGERDLARLARDLGFFDHGHFTSVFRRHYGFAPSVVRSELAEEKLG